MSFRAEYPATWERASDSGMRLPPLPITTASSASQSTLAAGSWGIAMASPGPMSAVVGGLIDGVGALLAAASELVTLEPGDVIATGTPHGVGLPRGEFLRPGDLVELEIADFGRLSNSVIAEQVNGSRSS